MHRTILFLALVLIPVVLAPPARATDPVERGGIPPSVRPLPPRTIGPQRLGELPVTRMFEGRYFVDADSSNVVIVSRQQGDRVRLESPGEWTGTGRVRGDTYRGEFTYRRDARDPRNSGARGTHAGTMRSDGRVSVEGRFTNRNWPPFHVTWTPLDEGLRFRGPRTIEPRFQQDGRDLPRGEPPAPGTVGRIEHPVWPPEASRVPEHPYEHPLWPPEWFQGDLRIVPAEGSEMDSLPRAIHRVEPRWDFDGSGRTAAAEALVVVQAMVEPDGSVSEARIAKSVPKLDAGALDAVRQWRFRPALVAGHPVRARVYVPLRFVERSPGQGSKP